MPLHSRIAPKAALRPYQQRIVKTAVEKNTIVLLPTGAGKTLIAAACAAQCERPSLFLVPTCLLVSQQAAAIREWSGMDVAEFMGGVSLAPAFDILVATPKAFEAAQARHERLSWGSFGLVVFDEVHHVLKEHPYRKLARTLQRADSRPRVLGLTASLTYAVGAGKVQAAVRQLCDDLLIDAVEHASSEELVAGGYHATRLVAEVRTPDIVMRSAPADAGTATRPPQHLMEATFFERVRTGEASAFALRLVAVVRSLEAAAKEELPEFESALRRLAVREWGAYASRLGSRSGRCAELEHWYEALRLLVTSWEAAEDAATEFLRMYGLDDEAAAAAARWPHSALAARRAFWAASAPSHARFDNLVEVLLDKIGEDARAFRGIVFVQQRVMTHILAHVIAADADLAGRVRSACLYASSSPATPSLSVSRAQAAQRLADFSSGATNLLIATSAAEEGVDVPAANCVIRFDPMQHAVSFVQGRGRARQAGSSFVVLAERQDRPVALLADMEHEAAAHAVEVARARAALPAGTRDPAAVAAGRKAAVAREQTALRKLAAIGPADSSAGALATLMLFCRWTKVDLHETSAPAAGASAAHEVRLVYESQLRREEGRATARTKKEAKRLAAARLLLALRQVDHPGADE